MSIVAVSALDADVRVRRIEVRLFRDTPGGSGSEPRPSCRSRFAMARTQYSDESRETFVGSGAEVVLEVGSDHTQLAQGAGLELADALAGDAQLGADLFERSRRLPV